VQCTLVLSALKASASAPQLCCPSRALLCCFVVCFPGVLHENDDVSSLSHRRVRHASLSDAAMASGRHFLLLITTDKYTNRTHGIGSYRLLCVLHVTFYVPHAVVASEWFYATLSMIRYDTIAEFNVYSKAYTVSKMVHEMVLKGFSATDPLPMNNHWKTI